MPTNSVIGGSDYIITVTDYRISRHSYLFYAHTDKFSCSGDVLFLIFCCKG